MNRIKLALAAGILAVSAGAASAAPLGLVLGPSTKVNITAAPAARGVGPINGVNAGAFSMTDSANALGLGNTFVAWCLDLAGRVASGNTYDYTIRTAPPFAPPNVLTLTQQSRVQQLFDVNYGTLDTGNALQAAAFQLALWEVAYEDNDALPLNVGTGSFQATSTAAALANSYLALLTGSTAKVYNLTFLQATNPARQDLVTATVIPIPAAAWLMLGALGALAGLRRQRTTPA